MKKGKIYIGTSGWHYKHWKGTFYPAEIKDAEQFSYYSRYFDTVEINNSFYRLPSAKTFEGWKKASPKGFLFAVKASRYITHMKKLKADGRSLRSFFTRANKLQEKTGPILFQLPPKWNINTERLADFLSRLPKGDRYTFEFRNHTWYNNEVYELLKKYNCAFCVYELEHHLSPVEVTADFVYIRLHGPGNKYQGSYTSVALKKWAKRCLQWQKDKKDVYVYFDNDQEGYAAFNAQQLIKLVTKKSNK
jgi:uncharacterized protein YecE (DUF72 family)